MSRTSSSRFPLLIGLLAALLLTVGCLSAFQGGSSGEAGEDGPELTGTNASSWTTAPDRSIHLSLADFPEGDEWIALELAAEAPNASLSITAEHRYDLPTDLDHCSYLRHGEGGLVGMGGPQPVTVVLRPPQDDPIVERHPLPTGQRFLSKQATQPTGFGDDGQLVVIAGHASPQAWADHGETFNLTLTASDNVEDLRWRMLDAGPMTCLVNLHDYKDGQLVRAGEDSTAPTVGQNLQSSFTVTSEGYGMFFPYSTGRHDVRIDGPDGTVWNETATTATEGIVPTGGTFLEGLSPAQYDVVIEQIVGYAGAGAPYLVADLTPNVTAQWAGAT